MISSAEIEMQLIAIVCYGPQKAYSSYSESKLFKVNFTSLSKCGTIEFRQDIATTNPNELSRWIRFVTCFVEMAEATPLVTWAFFLQEEKNLDLLFCKFLQSLDLQQEREGCGG